MARIYKKPTKERLLNRLDEEHKETINKMLELQEILVNNPPNDKAFTKKGTNYLIDYISVLNDIDINDYSDEHIKKLVNNLYNRVFKNRRY